MRDPHLDYRPDIDGLRAVAIITVICTHAFPTFLPGGFVGVDIFFVISGFLITAILLREISDGSYSITAFYGRRIRRLFPALAMVLATCLCAGYSLLLEDEYRQLGWHVAAGSGFFANIALWQETGYFDRASELKPLLHLWSLGIEEQFYLLWPLIIAAALRSRSNLWAVAAGTALLSFGVNMATAESQPSTAFFLPHTRFWELLLGATLAIAQHRKTWRGTTLLDAPRIGQRQLLAEVGAFSGLVLIALALALIGPDKVFPGWWAVLPTVGAVLLIASGPKTWIARRLMAARPLVWIGLISYPLYLWHWPLLSFARVLLAEEPSPWLRLTLIAVALLLAAGTYHLFEVPLRQAARDGARRRQLSIILLVTLGILLVVGLMAQQRIPLERLHLVSQEISVAGRDWHYPGDPGAAHNGSGEETVLFFGDSYIQQFYPRIAQLYRRSRPVRSVRFHTSGGCTPVPVNGAQFPHKSGVDVLTTVRDKGFCFACW